MRTVCFALALAISPVAMAQDGPCQSAETFSARRCAEAMAEAPGAIEAAAATVDDLNGCADIKKKKDLIACTEQLAQASRRLARFGRIMTAAAANPAPPAAPPAPTGEMERPE